MDVNEYREKLIQIFIETGNEHLLIYIPKPTDEDLAVLKDLLIDEE